jgi:uncharacterized cupin superfamily protein
MSGFQIVETRMKKPDLSKITPRVGAPYPAPHDAVAAGRSSQPLTKVFGLKQFGINRVELAPGSWSTQRHWHRNNDEAVVVVSGELVLVTDDGEEVLKAGDCVGFAAGDPNAHHLQNRSDDVAVFYDIGGRDAWDVSTFPDMGYEAYSHMDLRFRPIRR